MVDLQELHFGRDFPRGEVLFVGKAFGRIQGEFVAGYGRILVDYKKPRKSRLFDSEKKFIGETTVPANYAYKYPDLEDFLFPRRKDERVYAGTAIEILSDRYIAEDRSLSSFFVLSGDNPIITLRVYGENSSVPYFEEGAEEGKEIRVCDSTHEAVRAYSSMFLQPPVFNSPAIKQARMRISGIECALSSGTRGEDSSRMLLDEIEKQRKIIRRVISIGE